MDYTSYSLARDAQSGRLRVLKHQSSSESLGGESRRTAQLGGSSGVDQRRQLIRMNYSPVTRRSKTPLDMPSDLPLPAAAIVPAAGDDEKKDRDTASTATTTTTTNSSDSKTDNSSNKGNHHFYQYYPTTRHGYGVNTEGGMPEKNSARSKSCTSMSTYCNSTKEGAGTNDAGGQADSWFESAPPASLRSLQSNVTVPSTSITYGSQSKLPRLPVPSLEETLRSRFPAALEALQDERQQAETKRVAEEFLAGEGPKLQKLLLEYEKEGVETGRIGSYVEEFWYVHTHTNTRTQSQSCLTTIPNLHPPNIILFRLLII